MPNLQDILSMLMGQAQPQAQPQQQSQDDLFRQMAADYALNKAGSVMGSAKQLPAEAAKQQGPALSAINQVLQQLNPINWMGGPEGAALAHVPGTYRAMGLERTSGALNPAQYLAKLQTQENYPRFQQLVQMLTKMFMGEQFPVARGMAQTDPVVQALQAGARAPVTAVSHGLGEPAGVAHYLESGQKVPEGISDTAERFAQTLAEKTRKPSYVMQGTATPADVAAFVPRRGQYSQEKELILQPTPSFQGGLTARYIPPSSGFPWVERKALGPIQELLDALTQAAQPPK